MTRHRQGLLFDIKIPPHLQQQNTEVEDQMKSDVSRCAGRIKRALREDQINELAAETGFCQRLRKLTPIRAIWVFVTAMASGTANSLADILRVFCDLTGECMCHGR